MRQFLRCPRGPAITSASTTLRSHENGQPHKCFGSRKRIWSLLPMPSKALLRVALVLVATGLFLFSLALTSGMARLTICTIEYDHHFCTCDLICSARLKVLNLFRTPLGRPMKVLTTRSVKHNPGQGQVNNTFRFGALSPQGPSSSYLTAFRLGTPWKASAKCYPRVSARG